MYTFHSRKESNTYIVEIVRSLANPTLSRQPYGKGKVEAAGLTRGKEEEEEEANFIGIVEYASPFPSLPPFPPSPTNPASGQSGEAAIRMSIA